LISLDRCQRDFTTEDAQNTEKKEQVGAKDNGESQASRLFGAKQIPRSARDPQWSPALREWREAPRGTAGIFF
jgi:hypothetical protein